MLDTSKVGFEFETYAFDVEKGRIKFFAQSIGETSPIYRDEEAAQAAGYKTIPAPPTFPFVADMEAPEFLPMAALLDLDIARILHGSQDYQYFGQIYAGDTITVSSKISDMFDKKGGALEFIVLENSYTNQSGELVAQANQTIVYRSI